MTDARERTALELFERVLDLDDSERTAFLDEHCPDGAVHQRVLALLQADARAGGLLEKGADEHLATMALPGGSSQRMPLQIGPYHLDECLGEGGMATVYRAHRTQQDFQQTVALKLISPLRQTKHWKERFVQERQILASLQHPNIAVLIDGGVSEEGYPYFAMEYVRGVPITKYCDEKRLGVRARLRLLLSVCDAISYAHGKLIVHRDLKPGNILVDEAGRPKLLDFGIAKILSNESTDRTRTSLRALTPDYAAPEQFTGDAVTTAVDVYALGGLLFELLSGSRPFAQVSGSVFDIEREIRERGAPTFAQIAAGSDVRTRARISAARRTNWRRLQRTLRGDLENIVLKALRKEPERRYVSVEALATDLRRFLDGLPVHARADTLGYRLRKIVSRHPVGVPLGFAAVLALLLTSGVAVYQARQAETAAALARLEAAKANETRDFVTGLFEFAGPDKSLGDQLTARQLLDLGATRIDQQLANQPELHAEMVLLLANTYGQLGLYDVALPKAEQAVSLYEATEDGANRIRALLAFARLQRQTGAFADSTATLARAESLLIDTGPAARSALLVERGELYREQASFAPARVAFEEALAIDTDRLAPAADIARDLYRLGTLEFSAGDNSLGLDLLRQAATRLSDSGLDNTTQYASIQHDIGVMLIQRGELGQAKVILEDIRELRQQLLGSEHPDLAVTLKELAGIARQQGDSDEAERLYLEALEINEAMLGNEHPETANTLNSLAVFYRGLGNDVLSLEYAQRALAGARKVYGPQHPTVGLMTVNVGSMQRMLGKLDAALQSSEEGLAIIVATLGEEHHLAGVAYNALAGIQHDRGDAITAEQNYREALDIFAATAGENHPHMVSILNGLASLLTEAGRLEEAGEAYSRAVAVGSQALPPGHPNLATIQVGIAHVAALSGRCEEAHRLLAEYGPGAGEATVAARRNAPDVIREACP